MEGARLTIAYLPAEVDEAQHSREQIEKNSGQAMLLPGDLSTARDCQEAAERATAGLDRGIDILVNNAAFREEKGDITDITE
jgi:NAD(P)-dependent dehydrogenase (short-subunit alcohol dehydrogenase family)